VGVPAYPAAPGDGVFLEMDVALRQQREILDGRHDGPVALEHPAGNDHPLDLARAFVDHRQAHVAQQLLDGEEARVAVTPEDLQGLAHHLEGGLGGVELGDRGRDGRVHPRIVLPSGLPGQEAGRFHLLVHLGDLEVDGLKVRQPGAEGASLLCIVDGQLHGRPCGPDAEGADDRPCAGKGGHGHHEPFTGLRQDVLRRHPDVDEVNARRVGTALAQLRDRPADRDAGLSLFDEEGRDPLVSQRGIDGREDGKVIGHPRVGDPVLRAVQNVIVAGFLRLAAHAGHVRARQRLRCGKADELEFPGQEGKDFFPELPVSRQHQGLGSQRVVEDRRGKPRAGRRDLLDHQGALQQPPALASVFRRDGEVHDPLLPGSSEDVEGQLVLFIVMPGDGKNLVQGETAGLVSQCDLFRGE